MSTSHGSSRYIPMTYFDSLADARKTLRENSLLSLETQIELLDFLHTQQSVLAYQNFVQVYGYQRIQDDSQRRTLGSWLHGRVKTVVSKAATYYVSPDMCEMIRMAAEELPPLGLGPTDLPVESGFLFFSRPMVIEAVTDSPDDPPMHVAITAVAWEAGDIGHPTEGVKPGVSYWLFMNPNDAVVLQNKAIISGALKAGLSEADAQELVTNGALRDLPPEHPLFELMTEAEIRQGAGPLPIYDFSGWTFGTLWTAVRLGEDLAGPIDEEGRLLPGLAAGAIEEGSLKVAPVVDQARRLLLATWQILQQKITVLDEERPPRYIRRRAERRMPENGDIIVIRLRRETHGQLIVENPEEGPWWSHRWLVRGHWRKQPYGPGRSLVKPVWIEPYIKGPEGTPLVIKEKIGSLER